MKFWDKPRKIDDLRTGGSCGGSSGETEARFCGAEDEEAIDEKENEEKLGFLPFQLSVVQSTSTSTNKHFSLR